LAAPLPACPLCDGGGVPLSPSAAAWPSGGGGIIADGFPLNSRLGHRCHAMEGDGLGVGTMTATTTVTTAIDGSFLDLSAALVVADYAIGGAAAGVLFHGAVGCPLQVTNISFN
jgi:hypothetical protein